MAEVTLENSYLILVVDDHSGVREVLRDFFSDEGYRIEEAADGEEALAMFDLLHPDLVMMDVHMPRLNGIAACARLQERPEGKRTPVLIITALEDEELVNQAFNSGATDYITKPFSWPVLRQRVRRLLTARDAESALLKARDELESRVIERTAALSDANARLQQELLERQRVETALAQERDLLHSLMDNIPDNIYFKDIHSRFTRINRAQALHLGLNDPRDAVGKTDFDFFTEEHAREAFSDEQTIVRTGRPLIGKIEKSTRDNGQFLWVSATKVLLRDTNGEPLGTVGISRDITERMRADKALRDSEERFRKIFEDGPLGMAILDLDFNFTKVNARLCEMVGYTPEEFYAFNSADITLSEDREKDAILSTRLLAGQIPYYTVDKRILDQQGNLLWITLTVSMLRDPNDNSLNFLAMFEDITKRKRAESELALQYREAEHARSRTRAILDAVSDGIILLSPERSVLTVNRRFGELFGIEPNDVLGCDAEELFNIWQQTLGDAPALRSLVVRLDDREHHFSDVVVHQGSESIAFAFFSSPVSSEGGELLGRLIVFRDVTREHEVDRMKSEFVSTVSHELRTPLTSIKGYVELLLAGELGPLDEEQREFLMIVKNNADRLVLLINNHLDISRIESGKFELQRIPLDLGALVREAANTLRPQIQDKQQVLSLHIPQMLPQVEGDPDHLLQILMNLLSNAQKYTPGHGKLTVTVREESGKVRVDVSDTGIGIAPEEQSHLFDKFYRSRNQAMRDTSGTGLGLSITRALVERHGGEILVESALGEGSTFTVTLPALTPSLEMRRPQHVNDTPQTSTGMAIAIVQHVPDMAAAMESALRGAGHNPVIAAEEGEALSRVREKGPELVLLDLLLPEGAGFNVLRWLTTESARNNPVVLYTLLESVGGESRLRVVDYVLTTDRSEELTDYIRSLLGGRPGIIAIGDEYEETRATTVAQLNQAGHHAVGFTTPEELLVISQREQVDLALVTTRMAMQSGAALLSQTFPGTGNRILPIILTEPASVSSRESHSIVHLLGGLSILDRPYTPEGLAIVLDNAMTKFSAG